MKFYIDDVFVILLVNASKNDTTTKINKTTVKKRAMNRTLYLSEGSSAISTRSMLGGIYRDDERNGN